MKAALIALILAVPPGHSTAPVYTYLMDNVLIRTGTFVYKSSDMKVMYCISQPPKVGIQCVVRTPADRLVLIDAEITEHTT